MKSKASDPSALHVVLLQEVERYNSLLVRLRSSCSQVQAGLKGLVVMSADLDEIADALFNAKVWPTLPIGTTNRCLYFTKHFTTMDMQKRTRDPGHDCLAMHFSSSVMATDSSCQLCLRFHCLYHADNP